MSDKKCWSNKGRVCMWNAHSYLHWSTPVLFCIILLLPLGALSDGGVSFDNVADDEDSGLSYGRVPSATFAEVVAARERSLMEPLRFPDDTVPLPQMSAGLPGVAILDYDRDGDLDIYVTNGPGAPNGLFSSQLTETDSLRFDDVAKDAGVTAMDQDSQGVCFGDIDNDGDHDLLVLGRSEPNRLFENQGDGAFAELTESGVEGGALSSSSCAMGDVNGDGLLDIFVANSFDHATSFPIFAVPFVLNQHNQLFLNEAGNKFTDVSTTSGVEDLVFSLGVLNGSPTITWAVSMVDVDLDGDLDILHADDQAVFPPAKFGGIDRGVIHVFLNDGSGLFTDNPVIQTSEAAGAWMGLSVGDLNCDGNMDFFGSNFGDYATPSSSFQLPPDVPPPPFPTVGDQTSRWFYGAGDGSFSDPKVGDLVATPFGWGTAIFDYDNDGDLDILFHGGLDENTIYVADNPGTLLQNQDCSTDFILDQEALASTDHTRRNVRAVAVGDLNRDGWTDIVSAANKVAPETIPLRLSPAQFGSVFDPTAFFAALFEPTERGLVWTGAEFEPGDLAVELNSGDNGNGSVTVKLVGSVGITDRAVVNRDGIGAVVIFKPNGGVAAMRPIQGGSSHSSQNSLELVFGLVATEQGRLDVLWPGGVRNRLDGVRVGERIVMPEIPCSFDAQWDSQDAYEACVNEALRDLEQAGVIESAFRIRLKTSALDAFQS